MTARSRLARAELPEAGRRIRAAPRHGRWLVGVPERPADRRLAGIVRYRREEHNDQTDGRDEKAGLLLDVEDLRPADHDGERDEGDAGEDDPDAQIRE